MSRLKCGLFWVKRVLLAANVYERPKRAYKGDVDLRVALDWEGLAAHHAVALEPLAAKLLSGAVRGAGRLDGDAVVIRVLGDDIE